VGDIPLIATIAQSDTRHRPIDLKAREGTSAKEGGAEPDDSGS
jgi:hypothetical protein